jgi:hypothetical protein
MHDHYFAAVHIAALDSLVAMVAVVMPASFVSRFPKHPNSGARNNPRKEIALASVIIHINLLP